MSKIPLHQVGDLLDDDLVRAKNARMCPYCGEPGCEDTCTGAITASYEMEVERQATGIPYAADYELLLQEAIGRHLGEEGTRWLLRLPHIGALLAQYLRDEISAAWQVSQPPTEA